MFDFFETLIEYISMAWEFFLNFLSSLAELISAIGSAMILPGIMVQFCGGILGASIMAVSSFAVVKMLLGRNNV